eukprot:7336750-Lingulodinium_polyedra.AAC.1
MPRLVRPRHSTTASSVTKRSVQRSMRPSDTRSTPLKATNANVAAAHERSSPSQTTIANNN